MDLSDMRVQIDALDDQLIAVLGERLEICREVAKFKSEQVVPVMQPGRVEEVKQRNSETGRKHGLNTDFVVTLYDLIISEACRIESVIVDEKGAKAQKLSKEDAQGDSV